VPSYQNDLGNSLKILTPRHEGTKDDALFGNSAFFPHFFLFFDEKA
jgi:hypothetical protein